MKPVDRKRAARMSDLTRLMFEDGDKTPELQGKPERESGLTWFAVSNSLADYVNITTDVGVSPTTIRWDDSDDPALEPGLGEDIYEPVTKRPAQCCESTVCLWCANTCGCAGCRWQHHENILTTRAALEVSLPEIESDETP